MTTEKSGQAAPSSKKELRKAVGYENSTPICGTCVHYKKPAFVMFNSRPVQLGKHGCTKHKFGVSQLGCCDHWQGRNGEVAA